jgi:hypothetical protein
VEGQLGAGHPAGLAEVVGHAGWFAFVLAVPVGAIIALVLRGADAVIARECARARVRRCRPQVSRGAHHVLPLFGLTSSPSTSPGERRR